MKRREFLAGAGSLLALRPKVSLAQGEAELRQRAAAKGLLYGCSVGSNNLAKDQPFAAEVGRQAGILVHEYELKRKNVERVRGRFNFTGADYVMRFADRNQQITRGHTLAWHAANPDWLADALEAASVPEREQLLTSYIRNVAGRYVGKMLSWDVVNEPVEPGDWQWDGMRSSSPWFKALGEDYISLAFHTTKEVDSKAILFLNDYSIEANVGWNEKRRTATLKLLDRLKAKNVPVEGYGIQGHLKAYRDPFDQRVFADFLTKLEGYGLKLMVTEFDVADIGGPDDPSRRDADIASLTKSFLDVALASPAMTGLLTWGLSDRYSWLSMTDNYKWPDGQLSRGLPYDGNLVRKPMWDAIAAAFDAAPSHS